MREIVVAEDALLAARVADAGDHRGVVHLVRKDDHAGEQPRQRRQRRLVRDIARSEEQRGFLAVKIGQFAFEIDMVMRVAADRSEEHTSELQSLMRISYAVFCLQKKNKNKPKILFITDINNKHIQL